MIILILGIVLFLSVHTVSTLRPFRDSLVEDYGEGPYKGVYSLASAVGLGLIVWGFASYRSSGYIAVWDPPLWLRHVTLVLNWLAFVALVAAYSPLGKIKSALRHPMLAGVKAWALGHLLANGDLGSILLFGSLLAWAVYDRTTLKRRGDRGAPPSGVTAGDAIALVAGSAAFAAMFWLHPILIGVPIM
jgi:uncharacterized membrane protein